MRGDAVGGIIKVAILSAVLVAGCMGQAAAADAPIRVKSLLKQCNTDQKSCEEYLLGVWDGVIMMQEMSHNTTTIICPTEGPSGTQLRLALSKWAADADPKVLTDSPRVVGAMLSIKHAFPCTENSP